MISLSPRECQAVELLIAGFKRREIAVQMCISIRTVDYYLDQARIKSGKPTMISAVAFLLREGLILVNSA
jgi:DNA-binding NarL/FixJ family response regulator